ncbi:MAG TPA: hypothetical protein VG266_06940 [Candidatus Dormibacteraeota bacterium]|jgi:hypothetical protein|nr:hypothetical protein [Candidatus Dormibacteraeota bacterium]
MTPLHKHMIIGSLLAAVGTGVAAGALGHGVRSQSAPAAPTNAYSESTPCNGCPAGTQLQSVEVQARVGSVLFVVRGQWPGSVDALKASVCLNVNGSGFVLKPHGSRNAFEPSVVTGPLTGSPPAVLAAIVATSLRGDALLIDITAPSLTIRPLRFSVALCSGSTIEQRLPGTGRLVWSGNGAPQPEGPSNASTTTALSSTSSSSTSVVAASPTPLPLGLDVTALPRNCASIPSGTVPAFLRPTGDSSGVEPDPRSSVPTEQVTVTLAANPAGMRSPFVIAAVVLHGDDSSPAGQTSAIDGAGEVQLYAFTQGGNLHKAIRTFNNGAWTTVVDNDANAMTFRLAAGGASFFWAGLKPGDHYGFVTAAPTGCAALGLGSGLSPQLTVG